VEKVEDVIKKPEREIGTYIKNTIDINDARGLDLSLRERIQLTKMYLTKEQEDIKALEEISKQEEIKLNHVLTLRNFLLNELQEHLTDVNCEMVVEIDAKFAPYIQDVIREIELSYYCKEIPRNHDLARLHPNLPYRWSFKIRAI
jgi:predicted RNA-binding protein